MKKIFLLALSTLCIFESCNHSTDNEQSIIVISKNNVVEVNDTLAQDVVDSISIIPLEERPECLLGNIKKIQKENGEYFVMSEGSNGLSELYRFSHDGKFLNKIGRLGNARSEYIRMGTFFVYKEKVYIADLNKNRIVVYNVNGDFIDCNENNEKIKFLHDITVFDNGHALFSYNINFNEDNILFEVIDLETFKSLHTITTKYKVEGSFPFSLKEIGCNNGIVMLSLPFDNNIYEMDQNDYSLSKKYSLELWGDIPSIESNDFEEAQSTIEESGTNLLYGFFFSDDKILFNSIEGSVLWYINSNKGVYLKNGLNLGRMTHLPFFPLSVSYSDKEGFYSVFSSEDYMEMINKIKAKGNENGSLPSKIEAIREKKNPIIVKYILKSH